MAGIVTVKGTGHFAGASRPDGAAVIARLAVAAAGAQSLRELLRSAADLALEALPAERCSIFLADDAGTVLRPAWASGVHDRALWRQFRRMAPIDLTAVPARLRLFRSGRVAPVADLARSSLAPAGVPRAFGARAALLAPLVANGDALGLVVLDWSRPGRLFAAEEREAATAVAAVLALAVARFRPTPGPANAVVVRRVAAMGRSLHAARSADEVFDRVDAALHELFGARLASADMLLGHRLTDVPAFRWRPAGRQAGASALRLPLLFEGRRLGAASIEPASGHRLRPYEEKACADLLALAVESVARLTAEEHLRRSLQEAEMLRQVSEALAGAGSPEAALREANRVLRPALGVSLEEVALAKAPLRQAIGARAPEGAELDALRSWRAVLGKGRSPLRPRAVDDGGPGTLLVPLAHRGRALGVLRASVPAEGGVPDDVLLGIGAVYAEVVYRAGFLREVAESERRLAVAAERERIAQDLHDSVAQIVVGMGMRLAQYVAEAPDRVWRSRMEELLRMAGRGNRQVRQAIHELLFLDARRDGLVASVRELVRTFETSTGLPVRFMVKGTPTSLPTAREDALFRVAHEALMNIERHSRASLATVQLSYGEDGVVLAVRDDGVGLGHRDPFGADNGHFGIRAMQQRLSAAGGELRVTNARPRGVVVEGRIERKGVVNERRARRRGR
jgi:GAF domain-containing protein